MKINQIYTAPESTLEFLEPDRSFLDSSSFTLGSLDENTNDVEWSD